MQDIEYVINLATALANGMSLEDFCYFCQINDIIPCSMTLKMFLAEQSSEKEDELTSSSTLPGYFVIKFISHDGYELKTEEKNKDEAWKLFRIFQRTLHAELFQQVNGQLKKLA